MQANPNQQNFIQRMAQGAGTMASNVGQVLPVLGGAIGGAIQQGFHTMFHPFGNAPQQKPAPQQAMVPRNTIQSYATEQRRQLQEIENLTK